MTRNIYNVAKRQKSMDHFVFSIKNVISGTYHSSCFTLGAEHANAAKILFFRYSTLSVKRPS